MPKSQDVRQLVRLVGLALTLFTITVGVVAAAYGGWGYTVTIEDTNGSTVRGEDPYLPSCNGCPPFSGADLGAYNSSDTLTISASQAKTFKNNGSDVTGVTM